MKLYKTSLLFTSSLFLFSCVSTKKYNDLLDKQKASIEELERYQSEALEFRSKFADCEVESNRLKGDITQLIKDTTQLGNDLRYTKKQYANLVEQVNLYEKQLNDLRHQGRIETGNLQSEIDAKTQEIIRRQSQLEDLENDLRAKQSLLAEKEQRINELEEIINRKDKAIADIKGRIVNALKPYEEKGLTIEEKNGKIYVSLEAKLLFATGSTKVEDEGKAALVDLAKTLENETDIDIVVEGHTDTDVIRSSVYPRNNWELSVLRSTAVVEIMLNNSSMNPQMLTAAGRSEFFPVDVNDKAKNRRIEIIVSPDLKALFELISK